MKIDPKELQIEALRSRRNALDSAIESLAYNPSKQIMNDIQNLTNILHAIQRDIDLEINDISAINNTDDTMQGKDEVKDE